MTGLTVCKNFSVKRTGVMLPVLDTRPALCYVERSNIHISQAISIATILPIMSALHPQMSFLKNFSVVRCFADKTKLKIVKL